MHRQQGLQLETGDYSALNNHYYRMKVAFFLLIEPQVRLGIHVFANVELTHHFVIGYFSFEEFLAKGSFC